MLVWQADTRSMNPTVVRNGGREAYEADEAAAAAEYGAEFRRDIESYVTREVIDAVEYRVATSKSGMRWPGSRQMRLNSVDAHPNAEYQAVIAMPSPLL